ncbi:MAG: hypothetical protein H0W62_00120 [Chitinophagales bacterium]|nr:hypothetical protein [Chitinophagales bacterium]
MAAENIRPIQPYQEDEEIHLGPLWNSIKDSFKYLLRKWYWLFAWMAAFALLAWGYTIWYGKKYIATGTFAVQGQNAQNTLLGTALQFAGSVGIGTSSHSQGYDNNFFATLMQSQRVIKEAMLQKAVCFNKEDLLANHYITLYHWREGTLLHKGWKKDPHLKDFTFKNTDLVQLSPLEDSILTVIYSNIEDNNLVVTYDAASPFNTATFNTRDMDFSRNAMKKLIDISASYYMDNIYRLSRENLSLADRRLDSIANALRRTDYTVASMRDITNNLIQQKGALQLNAAQRNQSLLSTQYTSAINNLELAKVTLLSDAPILQIIDDPTFSTALSFVSLPLALIIGSILGFFFGSIYLIVSRTVKESNRKIKERMHLYEEQMKHQGSATA